MSATGSGKISGLLPLRVTGNRDDRDLDRARILLRSLEQFADPALFEEFLIVVPTREVALLAEHDIGSPNLPVSIVDEVELTPGMERYPSVGGWTKQQLVKLAAGRRVRTPFYITFDADVVCTHPIDYATLVPGGKALLQLTSKQPHQHWWRASARLLGVDPRLSELGIAITPVVLATEVCRGLLDDLDDRSSGRTWVDLLVRPHRRWAWQRLHPDQRRRYRWSEYSLYYLYLTERNLFHAYHVCAGAEPGDPVLVSQSSLWRETSFDSWSPEICFSDEDDALFCVVQSSNPGASPAAVRARLGPFLDL